jgi:hypothetical protein
MFWQLVPLQPDAAMAKPVTTVAPSILPINAVSSVPRGGQDALEPSRPYGGTLPAASPELTGPVNRALGTGADDEQCLPCWAREVLGRHCMPCWPSSSGRELAEGRGLAPGLVIRQWYLAGDHERMVRLARAHRAWAQAVDRLERSGKQEAAVALRLHWADDLAEAGDLEGAVRAVLPVVAARQLVERWIELAVAAGGVAGHALLGAWADLRPDRFAEVRERVLASCADTGAEGPGRRRGVGAGLLRARASAEVQALARPVVRALLADMVHGQPVPDQGALRNLAADALLEADLPAAARSSARPSRPRSFSLAVPADDRGTRPLFDAAALPGGRLLVALGEGGVRLLARDGREVARFEVPAHRLVVSDLGNRALAVGRRGEVASVFRLDLEARTFRRLRDLTLDGFVPNFDGTAWAVRSAGSVFLLDTLRDDLRTLWHVSELGGWPVALERPAPELLTFVVQGTEHAEGWCYQGGVLRQRATLELEPRSGEFEHVLVGGFVREEVLLKSQWHAVFTPKSGSGPYLDRVDVSGGTPLPLEGAGRILSLGGGARLVVAYRSGEAVEVRWLSARHDPLGRLRLEGAAAAAVRTEGDLITVSDNAGRVLAVDAAQGRLVAELRV